MRKSHLTLLVISVFGMSTLIPISHSYAEARAKITTCTSLVTKNERVLKSGDCISTREATTYWHILKTDTALAGEETAKTLKICSSASSNTPSYSLIRKVCNKSQVETIYYRSKGAPAQPVVSSIEAVSDSTVIINLTKSASESSLAPVVYYTVTSNDGLTQRVIAISGKLYITGLKSSSKYSFNIKATNVDGTSSPSSSDSVTTLAFVAPVVRVTVPVAQVTLLSNDSAAVTVPVGATSVAVVAPTLGNPSLSFSSQNSAVTATITTAANPASGSSTPFTVSGSTRIVDINVSGLTGSATVCLDASPTAKLWHYIGGAWVDITTSRTSTQVCGLTSSFSPFTSEEVLPAPTFTLSVSSRTGDQDSAITAVTATKTAHAQAVTYSISPALPTGLSINTSTGTISGTPTTTSSSTDYVITATNAAAGTATQTLNITVNAALSCAQGGACNLGGVGPGGGIISYYSAAGFTCGRDYNMTCHYLEAAPSNWDSSATKLCPDPTGDNWSVKYTQSAIGRGYYNSYQMYTAQAHCRTWSMKEAFDYRGTGDTPLSDWFIPSSGELHAVLSFLFSDAQILVTGISRSGKNFWSSTQLNAGTSVIESDNLVSGAQWAKNGYYTIPIRAF